MGDLYKIDVPSITMHQDPHSDSEVSNELLYGELCMLLEDVQDEWVRIRAEHDGYEGYIPVTSLSNAQGAASHKVSVPLTHIYETPDFKTLPGTALYFGSRIHVTECLENGFRQLSPGGWVFDAHLDEANSCQNDFVDIALLFKGVPYLWGGRTVHGIDCSGLVQIALMATGTPCPRDTKDQIEALGQSVAFGDTIQYAAIKRGDLVFFERHIGIMIDDQRLLNATSRHMQTVVEDLQDVSEAYGGILAIKRLS